MFCSIRNVNLLPACFVLSLGCAGSLDPPSGYSQSDTRDSQYVREWPRFLGAAYDGSAIGAAADLDWRQPPQVVWTVDVGDGYGIGSVAGGRLYQSDAAWLADDESSPLYEQMGERLRCLDFETGKTLWSESDAIRYRDMLGYEAGPRSSPTVVGNRVITHGVTGTLNCRDRISGELIWSVDTMPTFGVVQNFFGVASAPLVLGDLVIVMVGGSPSGDQNLPPMRLDRVSPNNTAVVAFDLASGKPRWSCGDDLASYSSPRPWVVDGESLVLVFARSGLLAIDPKDGTVLWNFPHRSGMLESVNAIVPIVSGNRIFVSECYEVGSVLLEADRDGAQVIWQDPPRNRRKQSMRCHWSTPVLHGGFLFGCSGRNAPDSDFRCVDFGTGAVRWSDPRRIRSSVTRVGDHLVVFEERGVLQILKANPERLEEVALLDLTQAAPGLPRMRYPCWSAPVVIGDKMLLRDTDKVVCLRWASH